VAVGRPGPRTLEAFARQGLGIRAVAPLTGSHRGNVFRATLADQTALRLRRFRDASAAARVCRCLQSAGNGTLPAVVGRAGCWLATVFVEGTPLSARHGAARRHVAEAAALLARIHASPRPRHASRPISTYSRAISLAAGRLARAGQLSAGVRQRLALLPRPARARAALTHGDFSPDNLIATTSGHLVVVDEERVGVRPLAYDLARAVCLWELDRRAERRFLEAYARAGGDATSFVSHRAFWIAAALATSALYRLRYRPSALPAVIAALRAF
jgi:aminoglycoside phosphotransferase (APT) family kinase protein